MAGNIVVVGSSNTDMIIQVPKIPCPGETILGGKFSTAAGGKGANQAVAAARAGANVTFIARVGKDVFGRQAVDGFIRDKINVENVITDIQTPSGVALISVDHAGENSIAVASGANANLSVSDIEAAADIIASADILLMQLEIPLNTVEAAASIAAANGVKVILNPAPAQPLSNELLRRVSILTPNETEAEILSGIKVQSVNDAKTAAEEIAGKGVKTILITLGSKGVFAYSPEIKELIPAFKVNAVDTTAAGDVFNGAFAVALAENKTLANSIRFANAAAALSVTKLGAQPSAPIREDIDNFLKANT